MKKFALPVFLAILGSLALIVTSAVIQADHAWGSYHWARMTTSFTLKLGGNVSGAWVQHLADASSDWNAPDIAGWEESPVLETEIADGGTNPRRCKPTSGRVEICSRTYGLNGWLGLAQIWIDGNGHITQGIVKVNDSYFDLSTYDNDDWRQMVMCQEIGHTFGLDHQDTDFENGNLGTCMDYTDFPAGDPDSDNPDNTQPNYHDFKQLADIYAHNTDGYDSYDGTVGGADEDDGGGGGMGGGMGGGRGSGMSSGQPAGPRGFDQFDLSEPGQWGQMIASSRDGRTAVFEIDFGNGLRIVTFVIWA